MIQIQWDKVSEEVRAIFQTQTKVMHFKRDDVLVEIGEVSNYLFLIEKGMLRNCYYDNKGSDITHWFASEGMLVTSPPSFFKREPSFFRIEAIEETVVRAISYQQMKLALNQSHELEKFSRELAIDIMIALGRKVIDLQTKSAEERYNELLKTYPDIFQRAKLGHIAGYLGITQQSLSRIRAGSRID